MYKDHRGYLLFPIKDNKYMDKLSLNISKDCTYSVNHKNVFRGLHINTFAKLITCITGHFIDIMVNMETLEVSYYDIKPGDQIYCPANYAHGFISLEDNSVLSYHCEGYFGSEVGGLLNYKDPFLDIKLEVPDSEIIINEKDANAPYLQFDYFLLGSKGYIGSHILSELKKQNKKVLALNYRMESLNKIEELIKFYKPKYLINAAGLTGTPNIKWCDTHRKETLSTNVISQLNILRLCNENNVHCTLIGSGAIFGNSADDKSSSDIGTDKTNYYSKCRILLEELCKEYDNYLLLRINYPISCNDNPKNLITKLIKFTSIEDKLLSITNLDYMIPLLIEILESGNESGNESNENKKLLKNQGTINFTNQGQIKLSELLDAYLSHNKYNSMNKTVSEQVIQTPKLLVNELETHKVKNINDTLEFTMKNFSKL